jgi:hypothetical protein
MDNVAFVGAGLSRPLSHVKNRLILHNTANGQLLTI